jgi:hypothetical protein
MLDRRYPTDHLIQRNCRRATYKVRCMRVELENAARDEHPAEKLIYTTDAVRIDPSTLSDALATAGDGIGYD